MAIYICICHIYRALSCCVCYCCYCGWVSPPLRSKSKYAFQDTKGAFYMRIYILYMSYCCVRPDYILTYTFLPTFESLSPTPHRFFSFNNHFISEACFFCCCTYKNSLNIIRLASKIYIFAKSWREIPFWWGRPYVICIRMYICSMRLLRSETGLFSVVVRVYIWGCMCLCEVIFCMCE